MTSFRLYLLGLGLLFGAYVALEYYRPKPLDWTPTLSNKDKIPYGTYALYDVLPQLLGTDSVASVRLPIYNKFFDEDEAQAAPNTASHPLAADTEASPDTALAAPPAGTPAAADNPAAAVATTAPWPRRTYVFINEEFSATTAEAQALLAFVASGNDVFIAASEFSGEGLRRRHSLTDSLGVVLTAPDFQRGDLTGRDSARVQLTNPRLAGTALRLPTSAVGGYFRVKPGRAGATLATDTTGQAVFIRLDHGRGHFYLCSAPLAFSNYFVLAPRHQRFALAALSYLPTGRAVWWDEYQKQGRPGEQSVLRVLMSHPSLRTAYYLLWVTAVLFIFIEARRRQRIIPVLNPLPNTTLLFTRTVASLYQQRRNHTVIAEKKVALFLDYLRTRFHEPAPDLGEEALRERLSQKSGVPRARVDELVRYINLARTAPAVTDNELLKLSRAIRDFKREAA